MSKSVETETLNRLHLS